MTEVTRTRVLVTVMTYPHPSPKYKELLCTAGITREGEWVRLYPIDYRYRPKEQKFRKYQWVAVDLEPFGHGNDNRKESRKPILDSIEIVGDPLDTRDGWRERRRVVDAMAHHALDRLEGLHEEDRTSLGIVRPTRVLDVLVERADPEWKPEWQAALNQLTLFGPQPKPLEKLPFKWSYVFECEDSAKPHTRMIEDWELGVLMGTRFPYNTWLVLGVFYPPKVVQRELPF